MATRTPKIPARSTLLNSSLDGMDDLFDFKTKEEQCQPEPENGGTGITEMDFAVMEPLPNHKFKLYTGQRLQDMVDSIREFGILEPLIVWVSPSEKAYCLKQHYDAIKSQGRRNDLIKEIEELVNPHEIGENGTCSEIQKKLNANEKVSEEYALGKDKIAKYLRIASLISPLMELLDDRKIAFEVAYDISFIKEEEKQYLIAEMIEAGHGVDIKKSTLIHDYAKKGKLTEELLRQIITGEKTKAARSGSPKPIKIKETVINRFFDRKQSRKEIEDTIVKALEFYFAQNSENPGQKVG